MHDFASFRDRVRDPLAIAAAAFVSGFGALATFWYKDGQWPDLPGFGDFRSATFGGAILLPFLVAVLLAAGNRLPRAPREPFIFILAGVAAGVLAERVVASSINDFDSTAVTYHASFVIVAAAIFGVVASRALWRIRHARLAGLVSGEAMLASPWAAATAGATIAFAGLIVLDNYWDGAVPSRVSESSIITVGTFLLTVVVVAALAAWAFGPAALRPAWRSLGWGALLPIAVGLVMLRPQPWVGLSWSEGVSLVGAAAVVVFQLAYRRDHLPLWWLQAVVTVLAVGGMFIILRPGTVFASVPNLWMWLVGPAAIFVLLLTTCSFGESRSRKERIEVALVAATVLAPTLLLLVADWLRQGAFPDLEGSFLTWSVPLLFSLFLAVIPTHYYQNWQDEHLLPPGRKLDEAFWLLLVKSLVLVFTGLAAGVAVVESARDRLGVADAIGTSALPHVRHQALALGLLATMMLLAASAASIRQVRSGALPSLPERPRIDVPGSAFIIAIMGIAVWGLVPIGVALFEGGVSVTQPWLGNLSALLIIGTSVFVSAWVAGTSYESFVANVGWMEFYELGRTARLLAVACGIAGFIPVVWLYLNGMWDNGAFGSMSSTLGLVTLVIVGNIVVATVCGWCLTRAAPKLDGEPWFVSLHHPVVNVAHDAVLAGYFLLCFGIIQYLLLAMAPRPSDASGWGFVLELLPSIGILGVFLLYAKAMRSISAGHVASEKIRDSDVLHRRSKLSPGETRRLWIERTEGLGQRYQRKLNWALRVSSVGLALESLQIASAAYVDPTTGMQRVKPLVGPLQIVISRWGRPAAVASQAPDPVDPQASVGDRDAKQSAEPDLQSYPG